MASDRQIGHIDCDAFFASVELLQRPDLVGRPLIVAWEGPRSVVTTATYEARRFGVRSAIPLSQAKRLCPEAIVIPPNMQAYKAASDKVMKIVKAEVGVVEQMGLDEAYVDLTGAIAPKTILRRIVYRVLHETGLRISVGLGPNKLVAKIASEMGKPAGFVALSRREAWRALADKPAVVLPGVGTGTAEKLKRRGVNTVRDLSYTPEHRLTAWFGKRNGSWLWHRSRLECYAAVSDSRDRVSESRERTFATDLVDRTDQQFALVSLCRRLHKDLAGEGKSGRNVSIKVRLSDFTTVTRARNLPSAIDSEDQLIEIALELLAEYNPQQPVRLLGVKLSSLQIVSGPGAQLALAV